MGKISVLLTRKFLHSWKEFPLGGFLSDLCVLAVNADIQFNRQVAKYAKKTPSKATWLRLGCAVNIRKIRVNPCPIVMSLEKCIIVFMEPCTYYANCRSFDLTPKTRLSRSIRGG